MRKPFTTSGIWLFLLFSLAAGLALLLFIAARDTLNQTEKAARDKAVTLARVLGYAISGVVRQTPDQEGRIMSMLEEIALDPEVVSVGILNLEGLPILQKGRAALPKLPAPSAKEYISYSAGHLVVMDSFEIRTGCATPGCGCKPGGCTCAGHETFELQQGRYGLALVVNPKGRQGVRRAILAVFGLSLAMLAGFLASAGLLARSIKAQAVLARNVALEQQRRTSLESLGLVAAGLAHEIRNPLAAIAGYTQLIHEQASEGVTRERTSLMLQELARVGERLEEFLSFARKRNLRMNRIDLRSVVQDSVTLLAADAARKGTTLDAVSPKHPLWVNGDASQLKELLTNLIFNAIKASGENGRIEIRLEKNANATELTVRDWGTGIAPADLGRVFEPYFTTNPDGSGLGLAIARRIAEDHGAVLTLENAPEKGALARLVFTTEAGD